MKPLFRIGLPSVIYALLIWFAVVVTTVVVTFFLPETYASTARILVTARGENASPQTDSTFLNTQLALLGSDAVLRPVIEELDLRTVWAARYSPQGRLHTEEVIALLRQNIEVRQVRETSLISIRVLGQDRLEAAQIAAKMVEAYQGLVATHWPNLEVRIVEPAVPGLRPVKPDKVLNISLGILFGCLAGLTAGGLVFLILRRIDRRKTAGL
jgi:uncharacterized protein involved in exopolysaccharide biosynthesis